MNELVKSTRYTSQPLNEGPSTWSRLVTTAKSAAMLAPFVYAGSAFAEGTGADSLATEAKTQMTGIVTLLVAILIVGIGISVLWFANKNTKKGVAKAG